MDDEWVIVGACEVIHCERASYGDVILGKLICEEHEKHRTHTLHKTSTWYWKDGTVTSLTPRAKHSR
jgi:hypothetical protein